MKYIKLIIVFFMMVFLTGCKDNNTQLTDLEFLINAAKTLEMNESYKENFEYVKEFEYQEKLITVEWKSSKVECISNFGVVRQGYVDEEVVLTATFSYLNEKYVVDYQVIVPAFTKEERFLAAFKEIAFDELVEDEINGSWLSSHPEIINEKGEYKAPDEDTIVTLTLMLQFRK